MAKTPQSLIRLQLRVKAQTNSFQQVRLCLHRFVPKKIRLLVYCIPGSKLVEQRLVHRSCRAVTQSLIEGLIDRQTMRLPHKEAGVGDI